MATANSAATATKPSVLGSGTGSKPPLLLEPKPEELDPEELDPEEPEPLDPEPLDPAPEELELLDELDPEPDPPELELDPLELELELEEELEEDEELELLELEVRQHVGQRLVMKEAFETELFTLLMVVPAFCTWTDWSMVE